MSRRTPGSSDNLPHIDGDRLWAMLMQMAKVGETQRGGCNRQALTEDDRLGRDLFATWSRRAGCEVTVDQIGNIFARREGRRADLPPVLIGSHLDTQATGGRFDGVYGVLAGLEVIQTLNDLGIETDHPIEVVSWTNEEGCRFAPAMLGSGVVSGAYSLEFAYSRADKDGAVLGEELRRIGYKGAAPASPRPFKAAFEVHIEQGPILERDNITIGVVTGIQGAYWFDVQIDGASCHAGPTPMDMRKDPWMAAAPAIAQILALGTRQVPWGRATVGDVTAVPGARNTVPEQITFTVDLRHPDKETLDAMVADMRALVCDLSSAAGLSAEIRQVWHMPPTAFDAELVATVGRAAALRGYSHAPIVSGAGHDSLHVAQIAPAAMIFAPCAGGLSHNELEDAKPADLEAGANVLLHAVLEAAVADRPSVDPVDPSEDR